MSIWIGECLGMWVFGKTMLKQIGVWTVSVWAVYGCFGRWMIRKVGD